MRRRLYPGDHEDLRRASTTWRNLQRAGRRGGAVALFREALAMSRRLYPGDHPRVAGGLNNLSVVLKNSGDLAGADRWRARRSRCGGGSSPATTRMWRPASTTWRW